MLDNFWQTTFQIAVKYRWLFLEGVKMTLLLSAITVFFGSIFGSIIAMMKMSKLNMSRLLAPVLGLFDKKERAKPVSTAGKVRPLSVLATVYIEVIRGTPLMLQLYFFYFLLPMLIPALEASKLMCVCIALILNSAGYVSEIVRAGIEAVDHGQTEAARSLGMSSHQTMLRVVLPQAVKNILPALCNEFIMVIKETSLAATFFAGELMTQYQIIRGIIYLPIQPLIVVGLIYFIMTFLLSKVVAVIERRLKAGD